MADILSDGTLVTDGAIKKMQEMSPEEGRRHLEASLDELERRKRLGQKRWFDETMAEIKRQEEKR